LERAFAADEATAQIERVFSPASTTAIEVRVLDAIGGPGAHLRRRSCAVRHRHTEFVAIAAESSALMRLSRSVSPLRLQRLDLFLVARCDGRREVGAHGTPRRLHDDAQNQQHVA
jgi:hypothetical protein